MGTPDRSVYSATKAAVVGMTRSIACDFVRRGIRRNWLFAWTELGAERVGVVQGLLATCELQGVDPYAYLVDVLQRVGKHSASRAVELTPRMWKTLFADHPLRSDLDRGRDPPGT